MPLLSNLQSRRSEILAIAKKHGIKTVRVFGSVARGEETPESDIDLLIDLERPVKDGLGFIGFKLDMEDMLGRKVDIVFETGIYHRLRDIILNEARPL